MGVVDLRTLLLTLIILALTGTRLSSCPFCTEVPGGATVQRVLAEYAIVVLAEPASDGSGRLSHLVAERTLVGTDHVPVGRRIDLKRPETLGESRTYLVLSKTASLSKISVRALDKDAARFFKAVAALPPRGENGKPSVVRLRFFVDYLGYPHRLIAASVSEEFARAGYATVKALRPRLRVERLVRCLEDSGRFRLHYGLAYLMVGLIGDDTAKKKLDGWLADPNRRSSVGFDGLIGACLLVHGEPAVARVLSYAPGPAAPRQARRWFCHSLVRALGFHAQSEQVLGRPLIVKTLVALLEDPDASVPAVEKLLELEAWASWPAVLAARRPARGNAGFERATRSFLLACPQPGAHAALQSEEPARRKR